MAICLITVAFGSDLARTAVVTFFDLGLCRLRAIGIGGFGEPMLISSGGVCLRRSKQPVLASHCSQQQLQGDRPSPKRGSCKSEMSAFGSASGWTIDTALRGGVLSSIADSTPRPNGMSKPNNTIRSMMSSYAEVVPVKTLRSNEAICRRLPTDIRIICRQG
jgi:hypothetical protein